MWFTFANHSEVELIGCDWAVDNYCYSCISTNQTGLVPLASRSYG